LFLYLHPKQYPRFSADSATKWKALTGLVFLAMGSQGFVIAAKLLYPKMIIGSRGKKTNTNSSMIAALTADDLFLYSIFTPYEVHKVKFHPNMRNRRML